jgi:hypothetical protein
MYPFKDKQKPSPMDMKILRSLSLQFGRETTAVIWPCRKNGQNMGTVKGIRVII